MPNTTTTDDPPITDDLDDLLGDALTEDDTEWTHENIHEHEDVVECDNGCGELLLPADHDLLFLVDGPIVTTLDAGESPVCHDCLDGLVRDQSWFCAHCGEDHLTILVRVGSDAHLAQHVEAFAREAYGWYVEDRMTSERGFDFCDAAYDRDCYECGGYAAAEDVDRTLDGDGDVMCHSCDPDMDSGEELESYNSVPPLLFRHVEPDGSENALTPPGAAIHKPGTPYLGMEIEMEQADHLLGDFRNMPNFDRDRVWFMHDGSLDHTGVEMATHPATFEWYMRHFPWDNLQHMADLGARSYHRRNCGIHVHISADAFTHSHLFKFLAFHYRNPTICQSVGQRGSAQYSSWSEWIATRPDIVKFAKKQGSPHTRYMALNLTESATIELRYFRGNLSPKRVRKNLQWVQAVYEYTDTVPAVDTEAGLTFAAMLPWLKAPAQRERFPDLLAFIEKRELTRVESIDQHDTDDL